MHKGRSVLEFLVTYGWAITVVVIAVGALTYFNVIDVAKFVPDICVGSGSVSCVGKPYLSNDALSFTMVNSLPNPIELDTTSAAPQGCTEMYICDKGDNSCTTTKKTVISGQEFLVRAKCSQEERFKEVVNIPYTDTISGLQYSFSLNINVKNHGSKPPAGQNNQTVQNNTIYNLSITGVSYDKLLASFTVNILNSGPDPVDVAVQIELDDIPGGKVKYPLAGATSTIASLQSLPITFNAPLDDHILYINNYQPIVIVNYGWLGGTLDHNLSSQLLLDSNSIAKDIEVKSITGHFYQAYNKGNFTVLIKNSGPQPLSVDITAITLLLGYGFGGGNCGIVRCNDNFGPLTPVVNVPANWEGNIMVAIPGDTFDLDRYEGPANILLNYGRQGASTILTYQYADSSSYLFEGIGLPYTPELY